MRDRHCLSAPFPAPFTSVRFVNVTVLTFEATLQRMQGPLWSLTTLLANIDVFSSANKFIALQKLNVFRCVFRFHTVYLVK